MCVTQPLPALSDSQVAGVVRVSLDFLAQLSCFQCSKANEKDTRDRPRCRHLAAVAAVVVAVNVASYYQ